MKKKRAEAQLNFDMQLIHVNCFKANFLEYLSISSLVAIVDTAKDDDN
jgi:hypothetical protein